MRFPNDVYFLLCQGAISPQVLNNLMTGYFYEPIPLVDSVEYRTTVNPLMHIRSTAINFIASNLNSSFHTKPVVSLY